MNEKKKMTPELRFSGFADDWEQRKVQEIYKITRGYVLAAPETDETVSDEMPYPVYSSQTKNNGLMGYYKDYLYENAITWTTDGANAGTVNYRAGKFYCTNVCGVLLSEEGYSNKCAAEALNSVAWKWVSHVGNPKLMNNVMGEIPITLPQSLEEQNRLSFFFEQIDNLITLHQRQLEDMKLYKKGLIQKMFPKEGEKVPELRFPGFADDWEQCKFKDTIEISNEMVDPKTGLYDDLIHIGPGDIEPHTGQLLPDLKTVAMSDLISGKFHFFQGDVIYSKIRPELSKCVIAPEEGLASADAYVLRGRENIRQDFIYTLLQTKHFYKYATSVSMRTGMPKINREELGNYVFYAPSIQEQQRISAVFIEFDNLITLHQQQLEDMKLYKKGLLQKMFV